MSGGIRAITPLRKIVGRSRHGTRPSARLGIALGAGQHLVDRGAGEIAIDVAPACRAGERDAAAAVAVGEAFASTMRTRGASWRACASRNASCSRRPARGTVSRSSPARQETQTCRVTSAAIGVGSKPESVVAVWSIAKPVAGWPRKRGHDMRRADLHSDRPTLTPDTPPGMAQLAGDGRSPGSRVIAAHHLPGRTQWFSVQAIRSQLRGQLRLRRIRRRVPADPAPGIPFVLSVTGHRRLLPLSVRNGSLSIPNKAGPGGPAAAVADGAAV